MYSYFKHLTKNTYKKVEVADIDITPEIEDKMYLQLLDRYTSAPLKVQLNFINSLKKGLSTK